MNKPLYSRVSIALSAAVLTLTIAGCSTPATSDEPATAAASLTTSDPSAPRATPATSSDTASHSTPAAGDATPVADQDPSQSSNTPDAAPVPAGDLNRDDANVDARDYQQGDNFYFQSPSGNYTCAINPSDDHLSGCFGPIDPVPAQLSDCATLDSASITIGGYLCQTQGVMTGDGGGKVLPYGSVLVVQNTICTSEPTGIDCDRAGHGFSISTQHNSVY